MNWCMLMTTVILRRKKKLIQYKNPLALPSQTFPYFFFHSLKFCQETLILDLGSLLILRQILFLKRGIPRRSSITVSSVS